MDVVVKVLLKLETAVAKKVRSNQYEEHIQKIKAHYLLVETPPALVVVVVKLTLTVEPGKVVVVVENLLAVAVA